MRALVTGAAGFIGSHLVDELLSQNYEVVGIDSLVVGRSSNLRSVAENKNFTFIEGDIRSPRDVDKAIKGIDIVFHLAALADIVPSITNPTEYFTTNVDGTFNIVEAARRERVKKLVYAASSSCYGIPDAYPTAETAPLRPMYPYALTKMIGEELALHWGRTYDFPVVSLRFFNVFGPRARTSGTYGAVFGVFLAQMLAGKPLTVVGDGSQTRDFTYVTDVVDAIVAASSSDVSDVVMNVGSGGTYSINRLVELLGCSEVEHLPKRPGEPDCTFADVSKINRLIGWSAKVSFEDGVRRLLENLDDFRDAPVWNKTSIADATNDWFRYLGKEVD